MDWENVEYGRGAGCPYILTGKAWSFWRTGKVTKSKTKLGAVASALAHAGPQAG